MRNQSVDITTTQDLLKKMRAGKKEVHEIRVGDLIVPVRVLSIDETNEIRRRAILESKKISGDDIDKNVYIQKATLQLASKVSEGGAPFLSEKFLGQISTDEITYLYNEYCRAMDSINPTLEQITPEHFRDLVDALKKNILSSRDLSLIQLRAICSAFVELIQRADSQTSQKDN